MLTFIENILISNNSFAATINVGTASELRAIATNVNNGTRTYTGDTINITADINLNCSSANPWTPIGGQTYQFAGTFEGNNHTISGLYTSALTAYQGLFGKISSTATVKNITVEGSITCPREDVHDIYQMYYGSIVGHNLGNVINCKTNCSLSLHMCGESEDGLITVYAGGLVGYNQGSIERCVNNGASYSFDGVYCSYDSYLGGIVGYNIGTVLNCHNSASNNDPDYFNGKGGITGRNEGTIDYCYNTGAVTGGHQSSLTDHEEFTGGIAGINRGNISNSYNTAKLKGGYSLGGIAGVQELYGTINCCYNTGELGFGENEINTSLLYYPEWYIGGIVGEVRGSNSVVKNVYNRGDISAWGTAEGYGWTNGLDNNTVSSIGGLVASFTSNAIHGYNTGNVKGEYSEYTTGNNWGTSYQGSNTYFLSGQAKEGLGVGIVKTSAQLKQQAMVTTLNADQNPLVWGRNDNINDGYPIFLWQLVNLDNPITVTTPQSWDTTYKTTSQDKLFTAATDAQGNVTYSIQSQKSGGTNVNYFSIPSNQTAALRMAASTPVGTYDLKITVTAAGNANYNSGSKDIEMTVTVGKNPNNPISVTASQSWDTTFSTTTQDHSFTAATGAEGTVTYAINSQTQGGNNVSYFSIPTSGTASLRMAADTPAATYTVVIRATAAGNGNYDSGYKDITMTVTVGTASITYTADGYSGVFDNARHGITVTVSSPDGTTIKYGTSNGSYTEDDSPTRKMVGTTTVYFQITKENYTTVTDSKNIVITQAQGSGSVTIDNWFVGDTPAIPIPVSATNGVTSVSYLYKSKNANDSTYSPVVPTAAGEYTIKATFAATTNYSECYATYNFTINTAPVFNSNQISMKTVDITDAVQDTTSTSHDCALSSHDVYDSTYHWKECNICSAAYIKAGKPNDPTRWTINSSSISTNGSGDRILIVNGTRATHTYPANPTYTINSTSCHPNNKRQYICTDGCGYVDIRPNTMRHQSIYWDGDQTRHVPACGLCKQIITSKDDGYMIGGVVVGGSEEHTKNNQPLGCKYNRYGVCDVCGYEVTGHDVTLSITVKGDQIIQQSDGKCLNCGQEIYDGTENKRDVSINFVWHDNTSFTYNLFLDYNKDISGLNIGGSVADGNAGFYGNGHGTGNVTIFDYGKPQEYTNRIQINMKVNNIEKLNDYYLLRSGWITGTDGAGNKVTSSVFIFLHPDTSAPTVNVTKVNENVQNGWTKQTTLTVNGTENYCDFVDITMYDGTNEVYKGTVAVDNHNYSYTFSPNITEDVIGKTYRISVKDKIDNSSDVDIALRRIDGKAPSMMDAPLDVDGELATIPNSWSKYKEFSITAKDDGTDMAEIKLQSIANGLGEGSTFVDSFGYTYKDENTTPKTWGRTYKFVGNVKGYKTLKTIAKDPLDNESLANLRVYNLDNDNPTIDESTINYNGLNKTISIELSDAFSGIKKFGIVKVSNSTTAFTNRLYPSTDGGTNTTVATELGKWYQVPLVATNNTTGTPESGQSNVTVTVPVPDVGYYYVIAEDYVGNRQYSSNIYSLFGDDFTLPTGSIVLKNRVNNTATFRISAKDANGISAILIKEEADMQNPIQGSDWIMWSDTSRLTSTSDANKKDITVDFSSGARKRTIYYLIKDTRGNIASISYILD